MSKKRILVVDDAIETIESIYNIFSEEKKEYEILQALNGEIAFEIAQNEIPDLIITDWEMPGMDGIDLITRLKFNAKTRDIPVIMCTGAMVHSTNLKMALNAGAVDFVRKPVDKIELLARVHTSLRLAESFQQIKRLNESKDKIFSVISHDLRGPIGNIKTIIDIALGQLSEYDRDELERMLMMVSRQSASAFSILDKLFAWAMSQQNRIEYAPKKQSLNKTIKPCIDLLMGNALQKNIQIFNKVDDTLEAYFDNITISTVFRNFLSNSVKFTNQNGEIVISAERKVDFIEICIVDNGVGIEPERLNNIFNLSSYETTYGTDRELGSGLGLKLCQEFIENNKGTIKVESEPGKGTSFKFTLPIVEK